MEAHEAKFNEVVPVGPQVKYGRDGVGVRHGNSAVFRMAAPKSGWYALTLERVAACAPDGRVLEAYVGDTRVDTLGDDPEEIYEAERDSVTLVVFVKPSDITDGGVTLTLKGPGRQLAYVQGGCRFVPTEAPRKKVTLNLATGGESDYVIVVPDEDPEVLVKQAADLLQSMLAEAAGCTLPIVKESEAPAGKPAIYLGKTKAARKAGLPLDELKEWTFCKRVKGQDLFLVGVDASFVLTTRARWKGYRGTLKAVTSFLEDEVGVRFLLPGPNGTHVPKRDEIKVDTALDVTASPKIPYSYGRRYRGVYSAANNHNAIPFFKTWGGHSHMYAVPMEKYGKTHPEYFALLNGRRLPEHKETSKEYLCGHLCISNPEVQELMLKEMERQLDFGYEWVQLSESDLFQLCECANCRAIAGDDATEALWIVHRKLAQEMKKRRPGAKVVILAYRDTSMPPKSFDSLPDNVVLEMCSYRRADFERWKKHKMEKLTYVYSWEWKWGFLPNTTPLSGARQLRLFAANNVKGIYKPCFGTNLGLEGPAYYVYGKLLFNPDQDPQVLANDFYRAAYGKAYMPMKGFFDTLYERLELHASTPRFNMRFESPPYTHLTAKERWITLDPEARICYFFPPEPVLLMEEKLNLAFRMDDDPKVQARLRLVQREFIYLKYVAAIFTYYRAYKMSRSPGVFDLLDAELKRYNALIDSWYVENEEAKTNPKAAKWKGREVDGWPRPYFNYWGAYTTDSKTALRGLLSAPFTWDMARMRKQTLVSANSKRATPKEIKMRTLKIARLVAPVNLDGVPDEAAWKQTAAEDLSEIELGRLREAASFRAAYDDEGIYLSFASHYAGIEQAEFISLGRDGYRWGQERIEVFLDPFGARKKYFHFIFHPVAGYFYDGRWGFITDALDPLYGQEDPSWNGDWDYVTKVDKKKKRWTAEVKIPFSTLGVPPPKPGATWTMNVAREHPMGKTPDGKDDIELSLWSPNLAERGFCAPYAFGTLTFE